MKEVWKTIKDFDAYAVSNLGRVKRITSGPGAVVGRVLHPSQSFGYLRVCFIKQGKKVYRYVHVLVAKHFLPNPEKLPEVNHLGPKSDCRAHRLAWISTKNHALDVVRRKQRGDGVFFDKRRGTYRASVPDPAWPQHKIYLGSFSTKRKALAARKEALA